MVAVRLKVQKELVVAKPRANFQLSRLKLKNICYKKNSVEVFPTKTERADSKKEEGENQGSFSMKCMSCSQ